MSSPFMEQNRSLFSRFSEQLRSTPVLQVAVMAAAPAAAMIMGGAGLDSYEASQVLQNEGVEAYRALKAAVGDMSAIEAIKTAMAGEFETVGRNISFGGMAAAPVLPALAVFAKAAAHVTEFVKAKFGGEQAEVKAGVADQLKAGMQGLNQAVAGQSAMLNQGLEGLNAALEQNAPHSKATMQLG